MAIGLPIAVTIGWTLATPAERPAAVGVPGGAGALGAAPASTKREPVAVRYSAQPYRPAPAASVSAPVPTSKAPSPSPSPSMIATSASPSATPSVTPTEDDFPILTLPPVPTPTEISTPPSWEPPSAEPPISESFRPEPGDGPSWSRRYRD